MLDAEASVRFYVELLGFRRIVRPDFDTDGYWLQGPGGVKLHLAEAPTSSARAEKESERLRRSCKGWRDLPTGDHVAFLASDLPRCEELLQAQRIPCLPAGPVAKRTVLNAPLRCFHFAGRTVRTLAFSHVLGGPARYKKVGPGPQGAVQLFFFDPDGNAVEVGDCAPPVDAKVCVPR